MNVSSFRIEKSIVIDTDPATIWKMLTVPELMKQWMGDPEMELEIQTDWTVNSTIIISGFHHIRFENKGTILQYSPHEVLSYSHLSSVSRLSDKPDNYSILEFVLLPFTGKTKLSVTVSNFPTEVIFRHLNFYWTTTIHRLKDLAEQAHT